MCWARAGPRGLVLRRPAPNKMCAPSRPLHCHPRLLQVAKECVSALAAAARSGPDSIKDAAQLALTECTDDACQGEQRPLAVFPV